MGQICFTVCKTVTDYSSRRGSHGAVGGAAGSAAAGGGGGGGGGRFPCFHNSARTLTDYCQTQTRGSASM